MKMTEYATWATVTEKGQVTIPKAVREKIGVPQGGKVRFRVRYDGVVVVEVPTSAKQVTGRLKKYADPNNPVDAYKEKENLGNDRAKELGY